MTVAMDIEVPRNGDWIRTSQLVDAGGSPIDLTSNTLTLQVRRLAGDTGAPVASGIIDILPGIVGYFDERIRGADLVAIVGRYQVVSLAYDLRRVDGTGIPTIERRGVVYLAPGVTYGG